MPSSKKIWKKRMITLKTALKKIRKHENRWDWLRVKLQEER